MQDSSDYYAFFNAIFWYWFENEFFERKFVTHFCNCFI